MELDKLIISSSDYVVFLHFCIEAKPILLENEVLGKQTLDFLTHTVYENEYTIEILTLLQITLGTLYI